MEKLSVTIITLNEEDNIRDALESVKWADEIVVVDSGSTDRTVEICKEFTDKVYHQDWLGMNGQKAFAKGQARCEWLLNIDADERVSDELAAEIKAVLESGSEIDGFFVPRRVHYLGRWINHSGWYPDHKLRLFKMDKGRWAGTDPHDKVVVSGKTSYLKADLYHYTYKNIENFVNVVNSFTTVAAVEYEKKGKGCGFINIVLRPVFTFFKKYFLKQGVRDGLPGFFISASSAYYVFLKYVKLWELKNIKTGKESAK